MNALVLMLLIEARDPRSALRRQVQRERYADGLPAVPRLSAVDTAALAGLVTRANAA